MTKIKADLRPWYRQFWAWFILSPLIVVVIVSSFTVTLAFKGADDRVVDSYYKEGRMINMRLEEDLLAQALNIQADLNFETDIDELTLVLNQDASVLPEKLVLEFSHPSKAKYDHQVVLDRVGANQYQSDIMGKVLTHRWYLRLLPQTMQSPSIAQNVSQDNVVSQENINNKKWRLRGEINFEKTSRVVLEASPSANES